MTPVNEPSPFASILSVFIEVKFDDLGVLLEILSIYKLKKFKMDASVFIKVYSCMLYLQLLWMLQQNVYLRGKYPSQFIYLFIIIFFGMVGSEKNMQSFLCVGSICLYLGYSNSSSLTFYVVSFTSHTDTLINPQGC